ncbi:unnamed protein product [Ceutorhynchus assimilis]|uniref:C2H2-type domain-containing protein n=1 Tax=Ceutorhynchus assimilis TaxID=467358 RepID=A0A9N9MID7_9CUCU|nr:unnamed protein product [Ceutorhynchus assimilis]
MTLRELKEKGSFQRASAIFVDAFDGNNGIGIMEGSGSSSQNPALAETGPPLFWARYYTPSTSTSHHQLPLVPENKSTTARRERQFTKGFHDSDICDVHDVKGKPEDYIKSGFFPVRNSALSKKKNGLPRSLCTTAYPPVGSGLSNQNPTIFRRILPRPLCTATYPPLGSGVSNQNPAISQRNLPRSLCTAAYPPVGSGLSNKNPAIFRRILPQTLSPAPYSSPCSELSNRTPASSQTIQRPLFWPFKYPRAEKRFQCPVCCKKYTTKAYVGKHMMQLHREEMCQAANRAKQPITPQREYRSTRRILLDGYYGPEQTEPVDLSMSTRHSKK